MVSPLPWLTERLYRLRTGVPVKLLLGVRTEGDSESGVRGVHGAVALWDRLIGAGPLGNVAWEKDTLDTRFTWNTNTRRDAESAWRHFEQNNIYFQLRVKKNKKQRWW